MIQTLVCSSLTLALAIVMWGAAWLKPAWMGALNIAAWVGLVGCMIALYFGALPGPAAALAAAGLGALAISATARTSALLKPALSAGLSVGVALGLASVVLASLPQPADAQPEGLLLYAGQWAALAAALAACAQAAGFSSWRLRDARATIEPASIGLIVAGLMGGLYLLGSLRANLPSQAYNVALSSETGAVYWGLAPGQGGANALGLRVTLEIAALNPMLTITGALALVSVFLGARQRWTSCARLWAVTAVSALASLGVLLQAGFSPTMPDQAAYLAYAKVVGAELQIPERAVEAGGFIHGKQLFVLWSTILPEITALSLAALLCISMMALAWSARSTTFHDERLGETPAASLPKRLEPQGLEALGALFSRDMMVRAAILLWLGWFLGLLVTWKMQAVYGLASPNEWISLGLAILASGLVCMMFSAPKALVRLVPGIVASLIVIFVLSSLAMDSPPAISIRF